MLLFDLSIKLKPMIYSKLKKRNTNSIGYFYVQSKNRKEEEEEGGGGGGGRKRDRKRNLFRT